MGEKDTSVNFVIPREYFELTWEELCDLMCGKPEEEEEEE